MCYIEDMVILFYVGDCLMFSPSKYKIDDVYASIQEGFKIEDNKELKNFLVIDLYHLTYGSIHIRHHYLAQIIINIIPGMEESNYKPTPVVKPPLAKNERAQ